MKVALVHDWLTGLRGGERCLQAFLKLYPDADIFTLLHVPGSTDEKIDARVKCTSWFQSLPNVQRYYRLLLPFYPHAIRRFNFEGYDLVISLSHAAAKNIRVPEDVPHISYCFTPMRYIWDQAFNYFGVFTPLLWPLIFALRIWDRAGAKRCRAIVAISNFIAARIDCYYHRTATVIYPPVDTRWIKPISTRSKGVAFLYAGALVPYKKAELVVKAFNQIGEQLWIVGTGPEEARLKRIAKSNISFFGRVSDTDLADFYRRCRALVFPGTEDFGLVPVECMAAGRPVIALYDGALRETLKGLKAWDKSSLEASEASGVFIRKSKRYELDCLISSIYYFMERESELSIESCVAQAKQFAPERFYESWRELLQSLDLVPAAPETHESQHA